MRRFFETSLSGIFRSRWGIAVVIAVLVLAIVGIGRVFSDGKSVANPVVNTGSPAPTISVDPDDDDSELSVEPPPAPTANPGMEEPEAVAYAFASAWVDHKNVSAKTWHDGIMPNATTSLSSELNNVDPADVPASKVIGRPSLVPVGAGLASAVINTDAGTLTLRLVAPDKHWLVDGIDWNSA
jgi:hypothetical protein